jgi:AdoMet-dependent rRNA methyltransferase SPB1
MGKKIKSKARLDKYYHLAKEHGFRSRAAFKLIQLNKKFNFLESASCLIDLCAAPGGWLQVAAKYMPVSSIKIGIDLDPIKNINGVTTFQADITSEKCRYLIKKEIKHFKADVVLNDGAPNVGGQWTKDAYNQSELVLFAVKLATEFLKEGGMFITKVFRSSDYNSLMYVLKQLFKKVEATKPLASRNESAEIFVVCSGYLAPSSIDNKLLDPKYALKQLEDEEEMKMNAIKSIKSMFDRKVNRSGYSGKLYNEKPFKEFIECANPYQFLMETNKIKITTDECKKYLKALDKHPDYDLYFEDIQILGKKEIQQLIIWRNKIRGKVFKAEKKTKEEPEEEEDYEEKKMEELDEEIDALDKQRKKKEEAEKRKKEKNDLRMKEQFIKSHDTVSNDQGLEFDQGIFDFIRKHDINIEELDYKNIENKNMLIPEQDINEIDLSDLSEEDYYELMNEDIEENLRLFEENKGQTRKKKAKKEKKKKFDLENAELEEEEPVKDTDGIVYVQNKHDEDEEDMQIGEEHGAEEVEEENEEGSILDESDEEEEEEEKVISFSDDEENPEELNDITDNPLRKLNNNKKDKATKENSKAIKAEKNEEENEDSDTDQEEDVKLLGKKKKRNLISESKINKDNIDGEAGDLPMDSSSEAELMDIDEVAEIRALAKKMLRKKDRADILFKTYNRYAFSDLDVAPEWFADDEKEHNRANKPISKEEVMKEKEILKQVNDRMPKKVLQAKQRKRNKISRRMEKVKKQAQTISNQEEINEVSKVRQIEKLYKKEMNKMKEKKRYIVSRSGRVKGGKSGRNIKHVDKRLKKDKRATKAGEKRKKNGKK